MKTLKVYTDGACSGNPGPGGWAAVLLYAGAQKEISGSAPDTTNNRMELLAVIEGLKAVKPQPGLKIEVLSDSAYIINAVNQKWLTGWQQNGWRTADKGEVKNKDLWTQIIELNNRLSPTYIKVKGHADDPYNNRADELAVAATKKK